MSLLYPSSIWHARWLALSLPYASFADGIKFYEPSLCEILLLIRA